MITELRLVVSLWIPTITATALKVVPEKPGLSRFLVEVGLTAESRRQDGKSKTNPAGCYEGGADAWPTPEVSLHHLYPRDPLYTAMLTTTFSTHTLKTDHANCCEENQTTRPRRIHPERGLPSFLAVRLRGTTLSSNVPTYTHRWRLWDCERNFSASTGFFSLTGVDKNSST